MSLEEAKAELHQRRKALAGIFRCGAAYTERLPMLPVALQRVAIVFAEELAALAQVQPEVKYLGLDSGRVADIVGAEGHSSIERLLHGAAWDAHVFVSLSRELVNTYIELFFGGDGAEPFAGVRPFSRIEMRLAENLLTRLSSGLSRSFNASAATSFLPEGEVGHVDVNRLGGLNAPVAIARYRLLAGNCAGTFCLAIPDAVLTALKPAFARMDTVNGKLDPNWSRQIRSEISRTRLGITAILEEQNRPLGEIASLRVGQVLPLDATSRSPIRVDCNGEPLLWCEMGKSDGVYVLRVQGFVDRQREFMNTILAG